MIVHVIVNEGGVVGVDLFGFAAVAVDGAPHAAAKADEDADDGQQGDGDPDDKARGKVGQQGREKSAA